MPTGKVIVLHHLVKSEPVIDGRHGKLGGIDGLFLQRRKNFAAG